jgi:Fic family protein
MRLDDVLGRLLIMWQLCRAWLEAVPIMTLSSARSGLSRGYSKAFSTLKISHQRRAATKK